MMFCGHCGKKVLETMLFCPFCGSAIVIPDQDEDQESIPETIQTEPEPMPAAVPEMQRKARIELFTAEDDDPEEGFTPLMPDPEPADDPEPDDVYDIEEAPASYDPYDDDDDDEGTETPERRVPSHPEPKQMKVRRSTGTYIPVRETAAEDMFLGTEDDAYDDDEYDEDEYDSGDFDEDYDFDEKDDKGFVQRHIKGIIAGIVVLILLFACVMLIIMPAGQKVLARVNLAWKPEAYAALGYEDYNNGKYADAAAWYMRAVQKDPADYEYAHSAMVSYYEAGDTDSAAEMAITCIGLKPDNAEPYVELLAIYGNGALPARIRNYIQEGYHRTGDERLNLNNYVIPD